MNNNDNIYIYIFFSKEFKYFYIKFNYYKGKLVLKI